MKDELSLPELFYILRKRARVLIVVPALMGVLALSYTYWIAQPIYASTATINISPLQVQSQLEQKILVQNVRPLNFESLKAMAFSEKVLGSVLASLQKVRNLPKQWQDRRSHSAIEYFVKDIKLKGGFSSQAPLAQGQLSSLIASFSVNAPAPDIAAMAANLWAGATARQVNYLPLDQLKISLALFEKTVTPAEQTYRAAQNRWEQFNRSSSLVQDKAQLDARIQERVSLDTERASLERNLAAVQGRIQVLESSANQQ
nr:lipopolysaccharide biosynthesis protein [Thermaceae bacterium]